MAENAAYLYIGAVVDELARAGVRHVCLCPGSRSTPLAISFARDRRFRVWTHLDERSAGFFALGLARADRRPAALVCTSGTAAANFMPAVVEALHGQVPLLVLTADRPPELRDCGAPQTIDQIRFYGAQVKWSVEMATPAASEDVMLYARATACRAVARALAAPPGPVHLNFPFRDPLIPTETADEIPPDLSAMARHGRENGAPYVAIAPAGSVPSHEILAALATRLAASPRGLIVCGPMDEPELPGPLTALARSLGYPILADPLSGLRRGDHEMDLVVDSYDALLRDERFAADMAPRMVLRFGAMATAKPLLQYLQGHASATQVLVGRAESLDPTLRASDVIIADSVPFCDALIQTVKDTASKSLQVSTERPSSWEREQLARLVGSDVRGEPGTHSWVSRAPRAYQTHQPWLDTWLIAGDAARSALATTVAAMTETFEGRVFSELSSLLPDGANLVVGNSMPVRDLDTFFPKGGAPARILGNRGANGIDGVVSTAFGVAAGTDCPTVLVLGDISFYHDMNGLLAARRHGLSLVVIVVHNDGGGIFSFLPQAGVEGRSADWSFESLFGTPHGLDFQPAAALYGATYSSAANWAEFRRAVSHGMAAGGLHIVVVPTDRARNVVLHRRCWPAVSASIAGILERMEPDPARRRDREDG
ncbi:MAG TPA: 2-succinyl-5-enolpyruvyl-6-hydroxy-3-cyclohexene-1-carboxylic-acid synthase [Chloroflexota bacterium]|nr:2-succinyl-5-enolpyruvyl-6-hydroxy-3-cyclohexene-1-carboxylic-acid synthase [Chloroflexota bacterium]